MKQMFYVSILNQSRLGLDPIIGCHIYRSIRCLSYVESIDKGRVLRGYIMIGGLKIVVEDSVRNSRIFEVCSFETLLLHGRLGTSKRQSKRIRRNNGGN